MKLAFSYLKNENAYENASPEFLSRPKKTTKETSIKILIVGDSGVGKSLLASILTCKNDRKNQCTWTIGANTEIAIHSYRQGTSDESLY